MNRSQARDQRRYRALALGVLTAMALVVSPMAGAQSSQPAPSKPGCRPPEGGVLDEPSTNHADNNVGDRNLDRPGFQQQKKSSHTKPDACQTCGVGLVAMAVTVTSPVSLVAALGLLAASQAELISSDPIQPYGIPLWGFGLACAGTHLFFAGITSLAFGRDIAALCSAGNGEGSEQSVEICPDETESLPASSQPAVPF